MRGFPWIASVLFGLLALAGCVGGEATEPKGGPADQQVPEAAPPAQFDEGSGAIEGLVHDDSLAPLPGAQVALGELPEASALADQEGRFTLSRVPPGSYRLFAQKLGYESAAKLVTVVAGEVTMVDVTLVPLPVVEPYYVVKNQRGLFGCGFTLRPVVGVAVCGVLSLFLNLTQYDKFLLLWQISGKREEWDTGVMEMEWKSNQALGRGLTLIWEVDGCSNVRNGTFGRSTGPSPLKIELRNDQLDRAFENFTKASCATSKCNEKKCDMHTRVFSAAETLGPSSPADVGVTIQQPFTQYFSEFYNGEAPVPYTAFQDR